MYTISRNNQGFKIKRVNCDNEINNIFNHAVEMYGQMVNHNEEINGSQWIDRIKSYYSIENPRILKVINSIKIAMAC